MAANSNPFADPVSKSATFTIPRNMDAEHNRRNSAEAAIDSASVLAVDRNAHLTLGNDSLIVVDEGLRYRRTRSNCFGFLSHLAKNTQAILFHHVLWAELSDSAVTIKYAKPVGRGGKACKVGYVHYRLLEKTTEAHAKQWIEKLLLKAYPFGVKRRKRIKVLVNPFGGQGYAQQIWSREVEPLFAAAQCDIDVEQTAYRGHATEITETIDPEAYDVIAAASGDGLPHEIFNGLARQSNPRKALRKLAVAQIPCGSGNAMCLNLLGTASASWAGLEIVKGRRMPLDLVAITQGDKKYYSFLSQAVGIVAETDLGTEKLRWMGPFRFTWGFLVRLVGKTIYPAEVSMVTETKDKEQIKQMYLEAMKRRGDALAESSFEDQNSQLPALKYGSVRDALPASFETIDHPHLGNFYTGNMPMMAADTLFFPTTLPSDGLVDLLTAPGTMHRLTAISIMTALENGSVINFPEIDYRKVVAYRIVPRRDPEAEMGNRGLKWTIINWLGGAGDQTEGMIAIDGERVPFEPFQAEVQQGLATVISRSGYGYEAIPTAIMG